MPNFSPIDPITGKVQKDEPKYARKVGDDLYEVWLSEWSNLDREDGKPEYYITCNGKEINFRDIDLQALIEAVDGLR